MKKKGPERKRVLKCVTHARRASGFRLDHSWFIKGGFRHLTRLDGVQSTKIKVEMRIHGSIPKKIVSFLPIHGNRTSS